MKRREHKETFTPWKRKPKRLPPLSLDDKRKLSKNWNPRKPYMFHLYPQNMHLDIYAKRAALKVSTSVVCLESYSGDKELYQCSGTIIESFNTYSIILTAARLLEHSTRRNCVADGIKVIVHLSDGRSYEGQVEAYDFHYNIAAIKIQSVTPLPAASLTRLKGSMTVDPGHLYVTKEKLFRLRPHSTMFDLVPGDFVIAIGRYFEKPYSIMAAPGLLCTGRCQYDCKELFKASCRITECGVGGPLINRHGQHVGICLHQKISTAFLPINIASNWWEHYKTYGQRCRPWMGIEVTNLYAAPLKVLEVINQRFPDILKAVIVEEVVPGSSAASAKLEPYDVIVQFGEKCIQSSLELFENMWSKIGETVEVEVLRASNGARLKFSMKVDDAATSQ